MLSILFFLSAFLVSYNLTTKNNCLNERRLNLMAYMINEQKFINDNAFKFEERLTSPLSKFLDKSPVFVTYFHINPNATTVNEGFRDVEAILGGKSPIRFQKIENFPLYGLEPIQLALQESEEGLNTDFQSECVVLPNTVRPLPNDFFMIQHIKGLFLFRVTEIQYDYIRADNFYKIMYKFESLSQEHVESINKQVETKYSCVFSKIGTEDSCIIQEEYLTQMELVDSLFSDMVNTYIAIFYSERYNCFLGDTDNGLKLFDPLQSVFLNKHKILLKKNDYSTIILSDGFEDNKRKIKYEKSIYRFFERRDVKLINEFQYNTFPGMYRKDSMFYRWHDESIQVVDMPTGKIDKGTNNFLPIELVNSFRMNGPTESRYVDLMQKFIRNESISIYDIPLDLNEELLRLDANAEVFLFTPILLYIIQTITSDFLSEHQSTITPDFTSGSRKAEDL